jgi:hypothetical protein
MSRESSVTVVTRPRARRPWNRGSISPRPDGSGAYPVGTGGSLLDHKATET